MPASQPKKRNDGRFVLLCFLGFFGVIGAVDFIFVTTALKTHTGVIKDRSYERGLNYNQTIQQAEKQNALGFKDTVSFKDGILTWNIKDDKDTPIQNLEVKAFIIRPVQKGFDFDLTLNETQEGLYTALVNAPLKGRWLAEVETQWNEQPYKNTLEILIP